MVRNRQRLVAEALGGLERAGHVRQPVHGGHAGVQVQLYALFRRRILPECGLRQIDIVDIEGQLLGKPGHFAHATDGHLLLAAKKRRDAFKKPVRLAPVKEAGRTIDGIRVVRKIQLDAVAPLAVPALPPALAQLAGQETALNGHRRSALLKLRDGRPRFVANPGAVEHIRLLFGRGGCGNRRRGSGRAVWGCGCGCLRPLRRRGRRRPGGLVKLHQDVHAAKMLREGAQQRAALRPGKVPRVCNAQDKAVLAALEHRLADDRPPQIHIQFRQDCSNFQCEPSVLRPGLLLPEHGVRLQNQALHHLRRGAA